MSRVSPIQYRTVNLPRPTDDNPYNTERYIVTSHGVIGTTTRIYEAWEIANGRSFDFTTTTWVDEAGLRDWLGRVGSEVNRDIEAMPVGDDRTAAAQAYRDGRYTFAYQLIALAFPETEGFIEDGRAKQRSGAVDANLVLTAQES